MSRLLVTGSRYWKGEECYKRMKQMLGTSRDLLHLLHPGEAITLVYGAANGADDMAMNIWWDDFEDHDLDPYPADWNQYGKAAGPLRNKEMVDLGADLCLAFPIFGAENKGTGGCVKLARAAGIPTIIVWDDGERHDI